MVVAANAELAPTAALKAKVALPMLIFKLRLVMSLSRLPLKVRLAFVVPKLVPAFKVMLSLMASP